MTKIRVLLGGLGDDAHSVGLTLLGWFLEESGFHVTRLGIQNKIDSFFEHAKNHEIIFISSINGHSELYLRNFSEKLYSFKLIHDEQKIWYVGGNLSVGKDNHTIIKNYLNSGFTRVYPKPVDLDKILSDLKEDLDQFNIKAHPISKKYINFHGIIDFNLTEINDDQITPTEFKKQRKEVLESYKTGSEVNEYDSVRTLSSAKNLSKVLWFNKLFGKSPLVHPRSGVADIKQQIELFKKLIRHDVSILSVQLDAASRRKDYDMAAQGLLDSIAHGESLLNGFPIPVHGVSGVKKIIDNFNMPFQVRGGAPDHRLTYEIGVAGGATGLEGAFLCYLFPYDKPTSPHVSLSYWKYIDHLCAQYDSKYNILINREFFGPLTSTLIEPCVPIVVNIIQALVSAKQGIRSFSIGYAEQGNREQDIAAMSTLEKLTNAYLLKYQFVNCQVTTVFHQYMAAFPSDIKKSEQLIRESSVTATLANATKIMTKTPTESIRIPNIDDNVSGVKLTYEGIKKARDTQINHTKLEDEKKRLEVEVVSIMNMIELLGNGHISLGAIIAFKEGILDIPFSPNNYNQGKSITFRGIDGAIRFANVENLPFPEEVKEFHQQELLIKKKYEGESNIVKIVENDLFRIWRNDFKYWPLDVSSLN